MSCKREELHMRSLQMRKGMTRRELEVTDQNEIKSILDKCKYLHLGLVDGDEPYVVAMNYGYVIEGEQLVLYLHAAPVGYKLDLIRKNPKVFFEMECDVVPFEGETAGKKVACKFGISYSSIMGKGTAELVENVEEKMHALTVLMDTQTQQDFIFNEKLVSVVSVIKITVSDYTAKHRPLPKM